MEVYKLQQSIEASTVEFENKKYSVKDLCFKPIGNKSCLIESPMDYWQMDSALMLADPDIKRTAKCVKINVNDDLPCMDRNGIPIMPEVVFGKQGCEKDEIADDCTLCHKTAQALSNVIKNIF